MNDMNKKPLQWAYGFCRILQGIVSILFILFLIFLIYGLLSSDSSGSILLKDTFKAGMGVGNFVLCDNCNEEGFYLHELSNSMILWLMIRGSIIFIIYLAIIGRILNILQSIKTKQTFYIENIKNFRLLTRYGVIMVLIGFFNFINHEGQNSFQLTIPFGPIMFTMACWVLAEIFREGKELSEDNKSIV
jgi:hypothetical protein